MHDGIPWLLVLALVDSGSGPGGRGAKLWTDVELANRPHFDAAELCRRNSRCELDGLVEIACLDEIEARELLLGFGEWPVGDRELAVAHAHGGRGVNGM